MNDLIHSVMGVRTPMLHSFHTYQTTGDGSAEKGKEMVETWRGWLLITP